MTPTGLLTLTLIRGRPLIHLQLQEELDSPSSQSHISEIIVTVLGRIITAKKQKICENYAL